MSTLDTLIERTIHDIGQRADEQMIPLLEDSFEPADGSRARWCFEQISETSFDPVLDALSAQLLFRWTSPPLGDYDDVQEYRLFGLPSGQGALYIENGIDDRILSGTLTYFAWDTPEQASEGISELRSSTRKTALADTLGSITHHLTDALQGDPQGVALILDWIIERTDATQRDALLASIQAALSERTQRQPEAAR